MIGIDKRLLAEARKIGNHRTNRDAIYTALQEYVRRRKQWEIIFLFGTIEYHHAYDYKLERQEKPR